jgi:hypothetical protein
MLDHPGLGECPALRTENRAWKKVTILMTSDTSQSELGITTHDGFSQHVEDQVP